MNRILRTALMAYTCAALAAPVPSAADDFRDPDYPVNRIRPNDTGGFSVYGSNGEYLGTQYYSDTGELVTRGLDGARVNGPEDLHQHDSGKSTEDLLFDLGTNVLGAIGTPILEDAADAWLPVE